MSTIELKLKKLSLIEWLTKLQDTSILSKIDAIRKQNRVTSYEYDLKPMSSKTVVSRARKANEDIKAGRVLTTEQLKKESENW